MTIARFDSDEWFDMEDAHKDGRVIRLYYPAGNVNVAGSASGAKIRRFYLEARTILGRWWTEKAAMERVGERAHEGMRGARIERDGGYWGGAQNSKPNAGLPTAWQPYIWEAVAERYPETKEKV